MDKSSRRDIDIEEQRQSWNAWNATHRETAQGEISHRQARVIEGWMELLPRRLSIIDIGCGSGWMSERLAKFGAVTGTDLADTVIARARERAPGVKFVAGDFMSLGFESRFDVAVSLEVLSHVPDQPAFVARVAELLRPGGRFLIATQNRTVLERFSRIPGPIPGQLRRWVSARELRALLAPHFQIIEVTSVMPVGDQGFLRLVNSYKLNAIAGTFFSSSSIERAKERWLLGHTLLAMARKRDA